MLRPTDRLYAASAPTGAAQSERLHGFDAIRGVALLLGVVLHASMSFLPGVPLWIVTDVRRSVTLSVTFFVIHVMRMTVFFLIAGFFGRLMCDRLGMRAFIRDRLKRIAVPLLAGVPLTLVAVILVAIASLHGAAAPPTPPISADNVPLMHLWFLYLLLWCYAAMLMFRWLVHLLDRGGHAQRITDRTLSLVFGPWAAALLAIPVAFALYNHPDWSPWFGVPTPDSTLIPNRAALVTYGFAFLIGWLIQRTSIVLLRRITAQWAWNLAIALAATVTCLVRLGAKPALTPVAFGAEKLFYAATYAVALWSWALAMLGIGLRFLGAYSARRRYLGDASYWIYIVHLPLVMALQLIVSRWAWPWAVKVSLILLVTFTLLLLSYRMLVRPTFVGAILNGRRYPRSGSPIPAART